MCLCAPLAKPEDIPVHGGGLWGTAVHRATQVFREELWSFLGLQSEQAATGTFRNSFG